jgi:hypothetical protein
MILGFELGALCLVGRWSATQVMSPELFALVIFRTGSHSFAWGWPSISILLAMPSE